MEVFMAKIKRNRFKYSTTAIMKDWRELRHTRGYAAKLAKKHRVPVAVIYNTVFQCRKKKAEIDRNYYEKVKVPKKTKIAQKTRVIGTRYLFQNSVVYAAPVFDY
jgi:hypothetical protein